MVHTKMLQSAPKERALDASRCHQQKIHNLGEQRGVCPVSPHLVPDTHPSTGRFPSQAHREVVGLAGPNHQGLLCGNLAT